MPEPCDEGGLGPLSDPMGRNKVKPEQASKVLMRMPTLRSFGEGRTRGEVIDKRTHAIRRGSGYGTSEGWFAVTGCGDTFYAHVVSYADDFVILSRGRAAEALAWTKAVMTKLGLTINEAKTERVNDSETVLFGI